MKFFTLAAALRLRRAHPDLFLRGDYEPLGSDLDDPHLVGFTRRTAGQELVVLVPRFVATLFRGVPHMPLGMERWRTASVRLPARLADASLVNAFTGERIESPWSIARCRGCLPGACSSRGRSRCCGSRKGAFAMLWVTYVKGLPH